MGPKQEIVEEKFKLGHGVSRGSLNCHHDCTSSDTVIRNFGFLVLLYFPEFCVE